MVEVDLQAVASSHEWPHRAKNNSAYSCDTGVDLNVAGDQSNSSSLHFLYIKNCIQFNSVQPQRLIAYTVDSTRPAPENCT